jgi:hypothetical protein
MDKGLRDTAVRSSFFFSGQAPEARPARCPMLTCNGRSCKCTSPAMAGYRPVKVYLVLSLGCNGEREVATTNARLRRRRRGCGGEGEAAMARQPCILYSIHLLCFVFIIKDGVVPKCSTNTRLKMLPLTPKRNILPLLKHNILIMVDSWRCYGTFEPIGL